MHRLHGVDLVVHVLGVEGSTGRWHRVWECQTPTFSPDATCHACGVDTRLARLDGPQQLRYGLPGCEVTYRGGCPPAAEWAGLGRVTPHQLRHTLATQAINRGMSLEAIAALLGHRSLSMTRVYARIADRPVADE
ncbi:tyrosine-type recombinase/integrase [Streptomyces antibioticus]